MVDWQSESDLDSIRNSCDVLKYGQSWVKAEPSWNSRCQSHSVNVKWIIIPPCTGLSFQLVCIKFLRFTRVFQIIKGKSRCQKVHRISCWRWHSHCGKWRWKRCRVCLKLDQFSPNWAQSQWEQCLLQISAILIFGSTLSPSWPLPQLLYWLAYYATLLTQE